MAKRRLTEAETATLIHYYPSRIDRHIIREIFRGTQNMDEAIKIFDNKDWHELNGRIHYKNSKGAWE
jgi:hypothetical protein